MKTMATVLVTLVATTLLLSAPKSQSVDSSITSLQKQCRETLGVSLSAIGYYLNLDEKIWHTANLQTKKEKRVIKELESAGLVKVTARTGLPDGQQPSSEFIKITKTRRISGIDTEKNETNLALEDQLNTIISNMFDELITEISRDQSIELESTYLSKFKEKFVSQMNQQIIDLYAGEK